jgi:hypothetical protein
MARIAVLQKQVANDQFRRWVEAKIEAADGAPAAQVTVLGGLAEFERQPIRERAARCGERCEVLPQVSAVAAPSFGCRRISGARRFSAGTLAAIARTLRRVGAADLVAVAKRVLVHALTF